jgi:sulfite exporter TauE/SafE
MLIFGLSTSAFLFHVAILSGLSMFLSDTSQFFVSRDSFLLGCILIVGYIPIFDGYRYAEKSYGIIILDSEITIFCFKEPPFFDGYPLVI